MFMKNKYLLWFRICFFRTTYNVQIKAEHLNFHAVQSRAVTCCRTKTYTKNVLEEGYPLCHSPAIFCTCHKAKRACSFLTAVHMVFSIQTHVTEKHNLNMFQAKHVKKCVQEMFRNVFKFYTPVLQCSSLPILSSRRRRTAAQVFVGTNTVFVRTSSSIKLSSMVSQSYFTIKVAHVHEK